MQIPNCQFQTKRYSYFTQGLHEGVSYYQGEARFEGLRRVSVSGHLLKAKFILLAFDEKADGIGLGCTVNYFLV